MYNVTYLGGRSIVIIGSYTPTGGSEDALNLLTDASEDMILTPDDGFTVEKGVENTIYFTIDLSAVFDFTDKEFDRSDDPNTYSFDESVTDTAGEIRDIMASSFTSSIEARIEAPTE